MDTSVNQFTQLLFRHGAIQTSPEHVAMLNSQGVMPFQSLVDKLPSNAGYKVLLNGYANFIFSNERSKNEFPQLDHLLVSLRSTPRAPNSWNLKGSITTFQLSNNSYRVDYQTANGQVVVFNIQPIDKLQKQRDMKEQAALYKIKRNEQGIWQVGNQVESVTTQLRCC